MLKMFHYDNNNSSVGVTWEAQWWDSWQVVDALSKCLLCHPHTMPLFFIFLKIAPHIFFPVFHISHSYFSNFGKYFLSPSHYASVFHISPKYFLVYSFWFFIFLQNGKHNLFNIWYLSRSGRLPFGTFLNIHLFW